MKLTEESDEQQLPLSGEFYNLTVHGIVNLGEGKQFLSFHSLSTNSLVPGDGVDCLGSALEEPNGDNKRVLKLELQ